MDRQSGRGTSGPTAGEAQACTHMGVEREFGGRGVQGGWQKGVLFLCTSQVETSWDISASLRACCLRRGAPLLPTHLLHLPIPSIPYTARIWPFGQSVQLAQQQKANQAVQQQWLSAISASIQLTKSHPRAKGTGAHMGEGEGQAGLPLSIAASYLISSNYHVKHHP